MSVSLEPITCSYCGTEMELRHADTERSAPLIGDQVEYRQYSCPECGQGARFEREPSDDEWTRAGL